MPYFGQGDGGDEKSRRILQIMPRHEAGVRSRFLHFADRVRIQHEVQNRKGLTKSFGIRGGCQSVVKRTESCQALSFFMARRAEALRRAAWDGCATARDCRASNQPSNSLACRADSFLTLLTARSTVLMLMTVAPNYSGCKPVLPSQILA